MAVSVPTVTAADTDTSASKLSSVSTAFTTVCGYIDTANTTQTAVKAGNVRALNALRAFIVARYDDRSNEQSKAGVLAEIDAAITANGG